jgi:hypothetical protein
MEERSTGAEGRDTKAPEWSSPAGEDSDMTQIVVVVVILLIGFGLGWMSAIVTMRKDAGEMNYEEDRDRL